MFMGFVVNVIWKEVNGIFEFIEKLEFIIIWKLI